jgi:MraZ protein
VSERELYEGNALQAVDDKGRIAVPADLRVAFDRNSTERTLMVGLHARAACLIAHDIGWSKVKAARVEARIQARLDTGEDIDESALRRQLHSGLDRANLDGSHRFILTKFLRDGARIGDWAFFIGAGPEMEIWAPDVLMASDGVPPALRDACRWHCEQRGVKL